MNSRRTFIKNSALAGAGSLLLPTFSFTKHENVAYGVQLYTFRDELAKDAKGTLRKIADLGIKKIESARSSKGLYYGLTPKEMKKECENLGMKLVSGHVALDENFDHTMAQAVESGQEYVICSSLPSKGQTVENYKRVADAFNKAGESCKKLGMKFGYHNHEYEFESHEGQVLYDVLMDYTDPELVFMELDLGWVVVAGLEPMDYFKKYPGRFPCWHLKDMDMHEKESTEFGKGGLDIAQIMDSQKASGVEHIFIEQEEYANNALDSMKHNMQFLKAL
ncbi:TIM barrel protein [Cytophaga sp. FL35]|uniref:sugar phosphate isomerase/epimerase family protein n=1 Tax=Cytophaga sp. FL35 TaxID=1904456 RepID=UPI00165394A3|nr:TIM barrel protein [Cytophaga sp. FL35]MBC6998832.1 sugar phosphate isomerase/epimerase [Cytophaga sp. FL35]